MLEIIVVMVMFVLVTALYLVVVIVAFVVELGAVVVDVADVVDCLGCGFCSCPADSNWATRTLDQCPSVRAVVIVEVRSTT